MIDSDDDYQFDSSFELDVLPFVDSALYKKVKSKIKDSDILKKLKEQRQKLKERKQMMKDKLKDPKFIQNRDIYAFTWGVCLIISTTIMACSFREYFHIWYCCWNLVLVLIRFFTYHQMQQHYFLLDFCFFSALAWNFYLLFYPASPHLFVLNFANSNGPILFAIIMWNNSLVFHSLDKVTSVFIHSLPPLVSYVMRWYPQEGFETKIHADGSISYWELVIPHMLFFFYWELVYYLKTEIVDREKLEKDPEIVTSFRWLVQDARKREKKSIGYKILMMFGEKWAVPMFMVLQGVFHLSTVSIGKFMYENQYFHFSAMVFAFFIAIRNGGRYYVLKFSKSYQNHLEMLSKEWMERNMSQQKEDNSPE